MATSTIQSNLVVYDTNATIEASTDSRKSTDNIKIAAGIQAVRGLFQRSGRVVQFSIVLKWTTDTSYTQYSSGSSTNLLRLAPLDAITPCRFEFTAMRSDGSAYNMVLVPVENGMTLYFDGTGTVSMTANQTLRLNATWIV